MTVGAGVAAMPRRCPASAGAATRIWRRVAGQGRARATPAGRLRWRTGGAGGRCRMHGEKFTGPRTPEGKARAVAAHMTHGKSTAAKRAMQRYVRTLAARMRLVCAAMRMRAYLPADIAARLVRGPAELRAPDRPSQVAFSKNADPMPRNVKDGAAATGRAAEPDHGCGAARPDGGREAGAERVRNTLRRVRARGTASGRARAAGVAPIRGDGGWRC